MRSERGYSRRVREGRGWPAKGGLERVDGQAPKTEKTASDNNWTKSSAIKEQEEDDGGGVEEVVW